MYSINDISSTWSVAAASLPRQLLKIQYLLLLHVVATRDFTIIDKMKLYKLIVIC